MKGWKKMTPKHMQTGTCENCGHRIYYQHDHWEHYTRSYVAHRLPYTTMKCYGPGTEPRNWYIDGVQQTCCGCMNPEPVEAIAS